MLVCTAITMFFWFKMLRILKNNGYDTSGMMGMKGYLSFNDLIKHELDPTLKKKYRRIYTVQMVLIPITWIGLFFDF